MRLTLIVEARFPKVYEDLGFKISLPKILKIVFYLSIILGSESFCGYFLLKK